MSESALPAQSPPVVEIRPSRGLFDLDLKGVWAYRELLFVLIWRDLQVLYKQAALGAGMGDHPARVRGDDLHHRVRQFRADAIRRDSISRVRIRRRCCHGPISPKRCAVSSTSLVNDSELVRKVYFPRLIMPLATVIAPLVDFVIAFGVLVILMLFYGIDFTWKLVAIPPLMLVAGLLALSISLWLGPINVRFRDVKHTIPFMMQIWMYASPIVYPLSMIPEEWRWAYSLNPMVGVIEGFRWAVFDRGEPNFMATGISLAVIIVLLIGGLVFFKRMERSFADVI